MTEEQLSEAWERHSRLHNTETRNVLTEHYLPMANRLAGKFLGRGVEREDLEQTAAIALMKALEAFDPGRGWQFTTYAAPTICGALRNHIRDKASLIRTPREVSERSARILREKEHFEQEHFRSPTPLELAQRLQMEPLSLMLALNTALSPLSLDAPTGEDSDEVLESLVGAADPSFTHSENRDWLARVREKWSPRENMLFECRFQRNLNQRDTAREMQVSQMQVSRLERQLLARLRAEISE